MWIKHNVVDFLGACLKVLNDSNDWKQGIFATSVVLHKVSRAKSYVFGALLMPYVIVIKNALLHHIIRNVGQQCYKVSKTEKLRGKTMGWKGCWLNSQLTDLLEENKGQHFTWGKAREEHCRSRDYFLGHSEAVLKTELIRGLHIVHKLIKVLLYIGLICQAKVQS